METFGTIDIYDTKGIEYLFIIGYLVVLIVFLRISGKQLAITKKIHEAIGVLTAGILRIPQGLYYSKNHTWTHLEKTGTAKVGVDDLLMHMTGSVNIRTLMKPGEKIALGDLLAEIEQNGKRLKIFSPISGEIIGANTALIENPEMLKNDPYEKGWLYKIKPNSWIRETSSYFLAEDAAIWTQKELERFKDFLAVSVRKYAPEPELVSLQDGGELRDNTLSQLPAEVWEDFQEDFLNNKN